MRQRMQHFLGALAGFLRGFLGLEATPRESAAVQRALEERTARRRTCC